MTKDKEQRSEGQISEPSQNGTHAARDHDVDRGAQDVGRSKFDLGTPNGHLPSENIPWGYGETRVTAMARDPDWLYVYWEITDEAIAEARKRIGQGGEDVWCCLRVYDTSHRVFDGTNANSYFDVAIDRTSRDWFVHVGKPQSTCHVEVGVKSVGGDFQAIGRSGRTDFPRKRPVQDVSVEWLTVKEREPPADPPPVAAPYVSRYEGPVPEIPLRAPLAPTEPAQRHTVPYRVMVDQHVERRETWRATWTERRSFAWSTRVSHRFEESHHLLSVPWLSEPWRTEWQGDHRAFAWLRPLHKLTWSQISQIDTWEMAPYPGDSAAPGRVVVRYVGDNQVLAVESGQSRRVVGPWEVTIHRQPTGVGERRVLGTWLLHWTHATAPVYAQWELTAQRVWHDGFVREHVVQGASESIGWAEGGASERWLFGASEQLWVGASELALGASEQVWLGASELQLSGASELVAGWERVWLGASELSLEAASELLARGASERFTFGASESLIAGASELWSLGAMESFAVASSELLVSELAMGASEQVGEVAWVTLGEIIGASELLGASERWAPGASETLGASEQLIGPIDTGPPSHQRPIGGASETLTGITGPRWPELDHPPDAYSAEGASEEVAKAFYPESLDDGQDDPSGKEGD